MQMLRKCVGVSISPICVRRDYRTRVFTQMHITNFAFLSAVATPKHLFSFVSSTVHIKPTHYDETHKVFVVELSWVSVCT